MANLNLNQSNEMNSTIKENIVKPPNLRPIVTLNEMNGGNLYIDNMQKRRLLFMRDQVEKKDIQDTSVNNTILDQQVM